MFFPTFRARRIRGKEVFRRMVSETTLSTSDLIYPMFSAFGTGIRKEISSMPGSTSSPSSTSWPRPRRP